MLKEYSGAAATVTLTAGIDDNDLSFVTNAATGYPTGATAPFVVSIKTGGTIEKLLIASRASTTFTVSQRGYDGTVAVAHSPGAEVKHVLDAVTIQEANNLVNGKTASLTLSGSTPLLTIDDTDFTENWRLATGTGQRLRVEIDALNNGTWVPVTQWTASNSGNSSILVDPAAASWPSFAFDTDEDTGFYLYGADAIGVAAGGTLRGVLSGQVRWTDGSAANPAYTFNSDTDTGFYRPAANSLAVAVGGGQVLAINSAGCFQFVSGTAADPSISFVSDSDSGFYRAAANEIRMSLGGNGEFYWNATEFAPMTDNANALGTSGSRWSVVYAATGTINTSDLMQKQSITDSPGLDFVNAVKPLEYKFVDGNRPHYGFAAQQVKQALDERGIDFGGYVDPAVNGETGPLGLRYSEFIAPAYKAIQELAAEVRELRAELAQLRGK